ncbi:hypothetical protein CAPTEDRAFT_25353, partial [Capitella teleta]
VNTMPKTSIIITFIKNEELSHLLRTLHSIIQRTPVKLLEEIILINDNSHKGETTSIQYSMKPAFVFCSPTIPLGMQRARLSGFKLARGEVIVPMDSHMEVQEGWLEPLLDVIQQDPRTLASSYLDWMHIDENDSWTYKHGPSTWKTYFEWNFDFGFQDSNKEDIEARQNDVTAPVVSPMCIGSNWAMRKDVFEEIGAFDEQMKAWGGENIDLALRVWRCGGRVLNIPCSHAAHLEQSG